ncbi:helix-turn-helix transcriptional regulator [Bifidobacterium catulorum]|uniref:DNA-binding protein n=1 Tax=Bifidobacterium catulorum TaxID=1630173 RepID=A0A2U2MTN5_9BIFI|nr:helix-turn-helix domain-containing protein [Bifidobacterium catulorum]PWG60207.1 hypothetical protein DF200_04000 [Bifidobacterium catulorum]
MEGKDMTCGGRSNGILDIDGFIAYVPGMTKQLAARLRHDGTGPVYIKVGRRILYRKTAIEAWLRENERVIASDGR